MGEVMVTMIDRQSERQKDGREDRELNEKEEKTVGVDGQSNRKEYGMKIEETG